jgi:hypothetical protein
MIDTPLSQYSILSFKCLDLIIEILTLSAQGKTSEIDPEKTGMTPSQFQQQVWLRYHLKLVATGCEET